MTSAHHVENAGIENNGKTKGPASAASVYHACFAAQVFIASDILKNGSVI